MGFRFWMLIPVLLCAISTTNATSMTLQNCMKLLYDKVSTTTADPNIEGVSDTKSTPYPVEKLVGLHVKRRSINHEPEVTPTGEPEDTTLLPPHPGAGSELSDVLRLTALLPAEALEFVRMFTVPLINTSLGVPANLLEHLSNSSLMGDFNGQSLLTGLSNLPGNASRWLHSNSSSSSSAFSTSGIGNLSLPHFPLQFPSFALLTNSSNSTVSSHPAISHHHGTGSLNVGHHQPHQHQLQHQHQHPSLFNTSMAGSAALSAAHFGERLFLTPVSSLLALAVPGGQRGAGASLPASLNPNHLQRHLAHLTRFLGAAGANDSTTNTAEAPVTTTVAPKNDNGAEIKPTTGAPQGHDAGGSDSTQ